MPAKHGRTFSLTDVHAAFIDQLVESGRYASASEVVRDGLRLLEERERRHQLLPRIALQSYDERFVS